MEGSVFYLSLLEVWGTLSTGKQRVCSDCGPLDSFRPGLRLLQVLRAAPSQIPAPRGKSLRREALEATALGRSEMH